LKINPYFRSIREQAEYELKEIAQRRGGEKCSVLTGNNRIPIRNRNINGKKKSGAVIFDKEKGESSNASNIISMNNKCKGYELDLDYDDVDTPAPAGSYC
jgi:hypothetical protein